MNKKPVIALFAGISALACAAGLAACGGGEHNYSDEWSSDSGRHYHACTDEGCNSVADVAAHTWNNGTEERAATCYQKGTTKYECTVCHYTKTEENIPTTDHVWGAWTVTAENLPTNEKQGKATRGCTNSGCTATGTEVISLPALTSDRYEITDNTATCGDDGAGTGTYTFVDANEGTITFTAPTPALAEHPYEIKYVRGEDTHWWQVTCKHTDVRPKEEPHAYIAPVIVNGKAQYKCKDCGYIKNVDIPDLGLESGNSITAEGYYKINVPAGEKYTLSGSSFEYAPVTANLLNYQTLAITDKTCPLYGVVVELQVGTDITYCAFNADGVLCKVDKNIMTNLAVNGERGSAYAAVEGCEPLVLEEGGHYIRIVKNSGHVLTVLDEMKVGCTLSFEEKQPEDLGGGTRDNPDTLAIGVNHGVTTTADEVEGDYIGAYIKFYTYTAAVSGQLTFTVSDSVSFAFTSKSSFDDACAAGAGDYVFPGEASTCTVTLSKGETLYIIAGNGNGDGAYSFNVAFEAASASGTESEPITVVVGPNAGTTTESDYYAETAESYVHYYIYEATASGTVTIGYTAGTNTVVCATTTSYEDALEFGDGNYALPGDAESFTLTVNAGDTVYILAGCFGEAGAYGFELAFAASGPAGTTGDPYTAVAGPNTGIATENDFNDGEEYVKCYAYTATANGKLTFSSSDPDTVVCAVKGASADFDAATGFPTGFYILVDVADSFELEVNAGDVVSIIAGNINGTGAYSFNMEFSAN